jgi:hypothetical protein
MRTQPAPQYSSRFIGIGAAPMAVANGNYLLAPIIATAMHDANTKPVGSNFMRRDCHPDAMRS